jgi:hypothetical protein
VYISLLLDSRVPWLLQTQQGRKDAEMAIFGIRRE